MTSTLILISAVIVGFLCLALDKYKHSTNRGFDFLASLPLVYIPVIFILIAEGYFSKDYSVWCGVAIIAEVVVFFFLPPTNRNRFLLFGLVFFAFSTIVFSLALALRPKELTSAITTPQITIIAKDRVGKLEQIALKIEPPLKDNEVAQVWIYSVLAKKWFVCLPALQDSGFNTWSATCSFGSDASPAQDRDRFKIGAFYTTSAIREIEMSDELWHMLKTQQTKLVEFAKSN
jgi:hypothetical protein